MKSYTIIFAAALIAISASAQVKVTDFPADMSFMAHINIKSLSNSKTGDLIKESMDEKSKRKMDSMQALSGIDLMTDLDSVYILGGSDGSKSGLIYATGRFDDKKLTTILGGNDTFKSEPFGSHNIMSWADKDKTHYGSFINSGFIVASDNLDQMKKALSLIEGKGEALASDSPFAAMIPAKHNRFATLAAKNVKGIAATNPQLQMLKQANSLVLNISQASDEKADLLLNAAVSAADPETAQQMGAMIQGIQAMMMMQAAQNPEVAQLAQNFKIETKETKIKMSLKLTEEQLKKQIAKGMKKANAPKPPEGAMPPPATAAPAEAEAGDPFK